jgi:hypothetical protein
MGLRAPGIIAAQLFPRRVVIGRIGPGKIVPGVELPFAVNHSRADTRITAVKRIRV